MSYVSVEELQKYSNVYSDDLLQQGYIDSAENIVNNYLGYSPTLHSYTHYLIGNGTHELQLKAKPIHSLILVEIDGEAIPISEFYFTNDEFIYYNKIFPQDSKIVIEYTAGYGVNVDDDIGNGIFLPKIINLTVLRIAALLQTESDSNIGVTSKSFADSGNRTFVNTVNFDKYLIQLSSYKLIVI
jgi:hypothetical protein